MQSFKVSVIEGTDEAIEDIRAAAHTIVRQYEDKAVFFALVEKDVPSLIAYIRLLHRHHRQNIYRLLAQEFTYAFRDGSLISLHMKSASTKVDMRALQWDRLESDSDMEGVLTRSKEHNLFNTVDSLMGSLLEETRVVVSSIRQFARACAIK